MKKITYTNLIIYVGMISWLFVWGCSDKTASDYKNPDLPIEERVQSLLSQMTLEEKVAQIQCIWSGKTAFLNEAGQFDEAKAEQVLKDGIGQIGRPSESLEGGGGDGRSPKENAIFTNAIQKFLIEKTRLGIPAIFHEEGLHGHAAKGATSFSQPIGLGSTWDVELIEKLYDMTAREARVRGTHHILTPVVDVAREPRWGRVEETYGEDPYLVAQMGLAAVRGFQGSKDGSEIDENHVISTLKHYAAHGQPESGTNIAPVNISERTLRETFFYPFKVCVEQGGVKSVMASYNEIDGVPSHANKWLIQDVLRDEWGFEGVVVSDYYAIQELDNRHHVAADSAEAGKIALETGIDIELPDPYSYPALVALAKNDKELEKVIDKSVARILRHKFELGLFEDPYVDPEKAEAYVGNDENTALALQAAKETIVMLKNENNTAPLDKNTIGTIAVIGPNADRVLLGGYSDRPPHFITVLQGIKERAGEEVNILYAEGVKITADSVMQGDQKIASSWYKDPVALEPAENNIKRINEAVRVAQKSDVIVLAIGGNEMTSREGWAESHLGDRTDLQMVGQQLELVKALEKTGKPIIVYLFNGKPLSINYLKESPGVSTIFECWYLGQETGYAVADVLFGDYNPGGKLPITFPRSVGHIPAYYNYKPTARRGYLFDEVSPLYAFGYGLSYTTFEMGAPKLEKKEIGINDSVKVSVEVTNAGDRAGDEVVQLYIRDKVSSVTRPVKELKGFKRVSLEPGEKKTVTIQLTPEHFSFFDINMEYVVEPGEFEIMVGNSSQNSDLKLVTLLVK